MESAILRPCIIKISKTKQEWKTEKNSNSDGPMRFNVSHNTLGEKTSGAIKLLVNKRPVIKRTEPKRPCYKTSRARNVRLNKSLDYKTFDDKTIQIIKKNIQSYKSFTVIKSQAQSHLHPLSHVEWIELEDYLGVSQAMR